MLEGERAHERHATTTATAPARVDLDRSRCARAGVGPCGMARVVVKNGTLRAELPQERQTTEP
jgi:hypothetical protein